MEFQTGIQHVFYRTKESSIVARSVVCKTEDAKFPIIQVGRFKNGWDASKYLIALNEEETEWIVEFIPLWVKRAYKTKPNTGDVFEQKEFANNRSISISLISFKNKKQFEFTQITIRDDEEVNRVVSFPIQTVSEMKDKLNFMNTIHKMILDVEYRLANTEDVYVSFLAYVHMCMVERAQKEPDMVSVMDENLLDRMKNRKDVVANYWIAAKYISVYFECEYRQLLMYVLSTLAIEHFDLDRLEASLILDTFTENPAKFLDTDSLAMFKLVKFIVDNKNTI